jgi:hypothetical protein
VADGFYREHTLLAAAGHQPLAPARTYLAGAAVNLYYVAAIWLGMALLASMVSIKIAVPAALVEIVVGALAGNIPGIREHVTQTDVVVFLASVGSLVLTFLAGAEIDPVSLRGTGRRACPSEWSPSPCPSAPRSGSAAWSWGGRCTLLRSAASR